VLKSLPADGFQDARHVVHAPCVRDARAMCAKLDTDNVSRIAMQRGAVAAFLATALFVHYTTSSTFSFTALRGRSKNAVVRSGARRCDGEYELLAKRVKAYSKSQDKEDQYVVEKYFKGLCDGTYVELGALDGVRFSNSHFFEFGFQWTGVLIEPNPTSFAMLRQNRPNNMLHNFAVCDSSQNVHFIESGDGAVTGILEFMTPSFRAAWHGKMSASDLYQSAKSIKCKPLREILADDLGPRRHIDFLSLDVEGAELEVLKTIDFKRQQFGVIFYEADDHNALKNEMIKSLLEMNGYRFVEHALRSNFHINVRFHDIYAHLAHD
jgi:FkbM family methyltransferase